MQKKAKPDEKLDKPATNEEEKTSKNKIKNKSTPQKENKKNTDSPKLN